MKQEMQIKYLPMPVSVEEKRKWNLQGFQVVDAKFAPEGYVFDEPAEEAEVKPARGRRANRDEE